LWGVEIKMSADPKLEPVCRSADGLAQALYFQSGRQLLFGWLHLAPNPETPVDMGLVICQPFGYESVCAHRSVRIFAEAAARMGVPTLRFDYLGTGDSAEIEPTANQLDAWVGDVVAAVDELQRRTGVQRVCLMGFRLGALLATIAAERCKAVDGLLLVAPVIRGKRHVRELRTTRLAAGLSNSGALPPNPPSKTPRSGPLEVGGFSLSESTVTALAQVDLLALTKTPVSKALIIDDASLPMAQEFSEALVKLGAETTYTAMSGIVEMLMTAPGFGVTSKPMVDSVVAWLLRRLRENSPRSEFRPVRRAEASAPSDMLLTLPVDSPAKNSFITERPVFFQSDALLFGILTEPRPEEKRRRGVILLNAGADHHIGASGINVSLARRWAQRGYFVLRMDFAGIGDSAGRPGEPDDEVFPKGAIDDICAGIEFLKNRCNVGDIALAGLCSGAYHALRAAVAGLAVSRVLMVNPQNFFWKKGMTVNDLQLVEVIRNPGVYRHQVLSFNAWKRLLSGKVSIWRIMKIFVRRPLLTLESVLRDFARRLHIRLPRDLGWELEGIAARGVRMAFVFARGEPGIDLLRIEGGLSVTRLGDLCRVRILDSGDHVFSSSGPRAELEEALSEELFARSMATGS
jgi:alpha-beta hydrolase superfamily lysophospholipase